MEDVLEFTQDLVECVNNDTKVSFMFFKVLVFRVADPHSFHPNPDSAM
jgi:hypothetical protein